MIMFNPSRILQIAFVTVLLGGCAAPQTRTTTQTTGPQQSNPAPGVESNGRTANNNPTAGAPASRSGFLTRNGVLTPDAQAYARNVAQTRHVPPAHIENLLKQARYNATVARLMTPSNTRVRRSWVTYRNRFVEPVRIKAGAQFWREHRAALDSATQQYGVSQAIIVAIIGVETIYGRSTGSFRTLDALATLAFRNPDTARPERSQMFRDQLADLIQLDNRHELNALTATGSFAGALGLPQFMPGSLLRYAVDGNNDGKIDLSGSVDDAIMSVANFLRQHGWVPGLPVFAPVDLPKDAAKWVKGGLEPTYTWSDLKGFGAKARPSTFADTWKLHPIGIIDLPDEPRNTLELRSGTPNFFAITHYNRSYFYAASVADLALAISRRVSGTAPY